MSTSVLDRPTFEAIEAYVLERMGADDRAAFEQRMAGDPALRDEVELERENILAVELGGVARLMNQVGREQRADEQHTGRGNGWKHFLKYAAVLAAIIVGALWFLRPPAHERLFAAYFTADAGLPVVMGSTDDPAFQDAMVAFKLGDYEEARDKWSTMAASDPGNDTLRYYLASATLAMGDAAGAMPLFEDVSSDPESVFRQRAQWYLFLAYVKSGNVDRARAMALDDDPAYGERVRAIKSQLK